MEAEAAALAADLGTTAYEERLKLVAGLPAIVLTSADPAPARALLEKLRARRHGAVLCDAAEVVPSGAMVPLRRFTFEPDALVAADVPGARLPYDDILGIFRASHQTRTETRTETKSKQFSAGRALLTGGLLVTKNVSRDETNVTPGARAGLLPVPRRAATRPGCCASEARSTPVWAPRPARRARRTSSRPWRACAGSRPARSTTSG